MHGILYSGLRMSETFTISAQGIVHGLISQNSRYTLCGWRRGETFQSAGSHMTCILCWANLMCPSGQEVYR